MLKLAEDGNIINLEIYKILWVESNLHCGFKWWPVANSGAVCRLTSLVSLFYIVSVYNHI